MEQLTLKPLHCLLTDMNPLYWQVNLYDISLHVEMLLLASDRIASQEGEPDRSIAYQPNLLQIQSDYAQAYFTWSS